MTSEPHPTAAEASAKAAFRARGGILSTSQALGAGIHRRTLYKLRDEGVLERLSYGLYRLADLPPLDQPDLVTVARRVPHGVLCLISALAFHELTTEIPHQIELALEGGRERPRIAELPLKIVWFSGSAYHEGIETHELDGASLKVYSAEKTLADLFKYRHKLGIDVALEGLKLYKQRRQVNVAALLKYARIDRVERVMTPYLEAVLT